MDRLSWPLSIQAHPYFTVSLLPSLGKSMKGIRDETFQRTKVCEDGGSAPWFDEQFKISYKPTEKKTGKIVHTDVVRMGFRINAEGNSQADVNIEKANRKVQKIAGCPDINRERS